MPSEKWEPRQVPMKDDPKLKPWDRQFDEEGVQERPLWYGRFETYRLLGPERSLTAAYQAWQKEKGRKVTNRVSQSWRRAMKLWNWQERAEAWDAYQLQKDADAYEEELDKMRERHVQEALAMQRVGAEKLRQILQSDNPGAALNAAEARKFIDTGVALERQARGVEDGKDAPDTVNVVTVRLELPEKGSGWEVIDGVTGEIEGTAGSPKLLGSTTRKGGD